MRKKPVYELRISIIERTYIIYKFSDYANRPIKAIHCGIAFNASDNYTKELIKSCKKYNLSIRLASLDETFEKFCVNIYLKECVKKIGEINPKNIPKASLEYCQILYSNYIQKNGHL